MKNDFDFYDGVEQDSSVVQDIKGLTDEVSKYIYSNMDFPCICVKENIKLPKHKWVTMGKLVKQDVPNKDISVYIIRNNDILKAGALSRMQVGVFIDFVGIDNLVAYYNKDKILTGSKIYILS